VNWEYRGGNINISRYETRTFVMDALPGVIAVRGTESQGGEGSTAEPLATPSIDVWQDIRATLANIVGNEGTIDVSQSSGTIVVSTTSDRMERASSYLSEENERLSRQVAINIEIYTVDINDAEAYGLDGLNILTNLGGSWADLAFTGIDSEIATGAASLPFTIFEPNEISGSNGIFRALSTLGKTARVAQIPLTTLNNRPAVQNVGTDTNYVSSSTTTTTDTSVATELETDTVRAGVSISILPRMMADGRILLQYALTQTDVLNIDTFSSSGTSVQLPQTQNLAFSQQVMLLSGSTLVLAGYDQGDAAKETRGLGRPLTWALGGGINGSQRRQIVVIAITPREIMIRRPEAS
jgi:type IVB pilus formation R64 PilN family outer membrane protein